MRIHPSFYLLLIFVPCLCARMHVLITGTGVADTADTTFCRTLNATHPLPVPCVFVSAGGAFNNSCVATRDCKVVAQPIVRGVTKNQRIRAQMALVSDADWFLVLSARTTIMVRGNESEYEWLDAAERAAEAHPDACVVGSCLWYGERFDHVAHKSLYNGACYRRLLPYIDDAPSDHYRRGVDQSFTRAALERNETLVCEPRMNAYCRTAPNDWWRVGGRWHRYPRMAGVYPNVTKV